MQNYNQKDTISAISTPIGEGAISIVRLSGKDAIGIVNKIFSKDVGQIKSRQAILGNIQDENKNLIDSVVVIIYRAPNSFTKEDLIEIQCHGGRLITQKVFETTLAVGARAAQAGEFTIRAFLNKKIDLTQAEAIQDLIAAKNDFAIKIAKEQLDGILSKKIKSFQEEIIEMSATVESYLDFFEEDIDDIEIKNLINSLIKISKDIQTLVDTFEEGKVLKEGLKLCIIGSVNVGKSSLMNALLKKDRAIVTNISGTTRDVLKEDIKLNNMLYQLIDTAGIRKTTCSIEKIGIEKALNEQKNADILLLVLDSSKKLTKEDKYLLHKLDPKKTIVIWNKIDICQPDQKIDFKNMVQISAKKLSGLDNLNKMIEKLTFKSKISTNEIIITKMRHKIALKNSLKYLNKAKENLKNKNALEFIAIDLKTALFELSKIIGFDITEDVLKSIFSKFCIGK